MRAINDRCNFQYQQAFTAIINTNKSCTNAQKNPPIFYSTITSYQLGSDPTSEYNIVITPFNFGSVFFPQFCPAKLSTLASYYAHANDRHMERLAAGEFDWAQCSHCGLYFPTKDILNNHINHRHNEERTGPRGKTKTCE